MSRPVLSLALALLASLVPSLRAQTPLRTELVAAGFDQPVFVTPAPGDSRRLFVLEKASGHIEVIRDGVVNATPFLDIGAELSVGGEQGLLGLAFHPDYRENGWFFVNFTNTAGSTKVRRYTRDTDDLADPGSGLDVLTIVQPQATHNAGMLAFGPFDGYLYISVGDGGGGDDSGPGHAVGGNAQSLQTRLGKILRLDVDTLPATPAPDNPFVLDGSPADEIWAYGLRNPWRFSFDRKTGDLYLGDVGEHTREEIDFIPHRVGGLNFGWRCMEGSVCTGLSGCDCNGPEVTLPIHDYAWGSGPDGGRTAVGGYVYRGEVIPDLKGTYIFADHSFQSRQIWSFRYDGSTKTGFSNRTEQFDPPGVMTIDSPCAFGEDGEGELYIVDRGAGGEIFKIVPDGPFVGLGHATGGTHGEPRLHGEGRLAAGTAGALVLANGYPGAAGLLFVSLTEGEAPFFMGVLKPVPWIGEPFWVPTDAEGGWEIPWVSWPVGLPPGTEVFFQYAVADRGNPTGVALSNALKGTTP